MSQDITQDFNLSGGIDSIVDADKPSADNEAIKPDTKRDEDQPLLFKVSQALELVVSRIKKGEVPNILKIADLDSSETFESTEQNRKFVSQFFLIFLLQNLIAMIILKSASLSIIDNESFTDMVLRYSMLAMYFGFSAYYSLYSPDLSPERYLTYSIGMGVLLGFALPYRSFAKSFVYTNVGTISAIFGCMYYSKGSGISVSNVKKCVALGVLVANLYLNYFFDNKGYILIVIGALLNILYAFELVNIVFERINDYDLDSSVRNSSPE